MLAEPDDGAVGTFHGDPGILDADMDAARLGDTAGAFFRPRRAGVLKSLA